MSNNYYPKLVRFGLTLNKPLHALFVKYFKVIQIKIKIRVFWTIKVINKSFYNFS